MLLLAMKRILKSPSRLEEGPMVDECGELEVHRVVGQHLGTKSVMVAVLALEATTFAPTRGGIAHTALESVKRVKSSEQILVKSFFWRLNAPNPLRGSSGHQRTPSMLTVVQPPSAILPKICSLLFTLLTLSGAVW